MKSLIVLIAAGTVLVNTAFAAPYAPTDVRFGTFVGWPSSPDNGPGVSFLQIDLTAGGPNAVVSVVQTCSGRLHNYGTSDAMNNVVYYDATMTPAAWGAYCVPIVDPLYTGSSVASFSFQYQDCGNTSPTPAPFVISAQPASPPTTLGSSAVMNGCQTKMVVTPSPVHMALNYEYGGLGIELGDGFYIGKSYMSNQFMSLLDGYSNVGSVFGQTIEQLMSRQVFRYALVVNSPAYVTPPCYSNCDH